MKYTALPQLPVMRWVVVQHCHVHMAPGSNLGASNVFFGASRLFWCLASFLVPASSQCEGANFCTLCRFRNSCHLRTCIRFVRFPHFFHFLHLGQICSLGTQPQGEKKRGDHPPAAVSEGSAVGPLLAARALLLRCAASAVLGSALANCGARSATTV
jgi:hypothetical protein